MKQFRNVMAVVLAALLLAPQVFASSDHGVKLQKPEIALKNQQSLQNGAKAFMTYCITCHSLSFTRYEQVAKGIGLVNENGSVDEAQVKSILKASPEQLYSPITSALTKEAGVKTYGVAPPDLTLVARQRGTSWLYTYLHTFYQDASRPSGVNNLLFPDVAMPNILAPLQGTQKPVYRTEMKNIAGKQEEIKVIDHLELVSPGSLSPAEFNLYTADLVNFLQFVAEPIKVQRIRIGVLVMLFLSIFLILAYLLKREYWRDVH